MGGNGVIEELRAELEDIVGGHAQASGLRNIWRKPLLVSARADQRFAALRQMVEPDHNLPQDLLPEAKSVVAFFIPFIPELARENTPGKTPSRSWGQAYVSTNALIETACRCLAGLLEAGGHKVALTPATHNFDQERLLSRWSHKHLAHIAGLGRFGRHYQLITPQGACGRLGSFVTSADLGDHPLTTEAELCLDKRGEKCQACIQACPVNALGVDSFDRRRCWERLLFVRNKTDLFPDLPESTHVCAKCQVNMPCSHAAPK